MFNDGEKLEINITKGVIKRENGETVRFREMPPLLLEIINAGGMLNYLKKRSVSRAKTYKIKEGNNTLSLNIPFFTHSTCFISLYKNRVCLFA